jgi:DNA-binding CsgD family transcriptional regulator
MMEAICRAAVATRWRSLEGVEMSRETSRIRADDLRAIYLLVGECCELGADPLIWRRHMLERLNRLFGAYSSINIDASVDPALPGVGAKVDAAMTIDHFSPQERELLTRCLSEMPLEANPLGVSVVGECPFPGTAAAVRRDRIADAEWRRCAFCTDYFDPLGWDDMMIGTAKTSTGFQLYNFTRLRGDTPFPSRLARMLELFVQELGAVPHARLAPMSGGSLLDLPPRQRAVLVGLAHGENEKQIALRLSISRNTVHEYVRRLFERYGISSRGELLVRAARQLHALEIATPDAAGDSWYFQRASA